MGSIWFAGFGACSAWAVQAPLSWRHGVAAGCLLLCAVACAMAWRGMAVGTLRWDGELWWWAEATGVERPVEVGLRLDVQDAMLFSLSAAPAATRWGVAERARLPARWSDLRRAVHGQRASTPATIDAASAG